jgi:hypothetical protein
VVTENNLIIVLSGIAEDAAARPAVAYVVLSGRLALTRDLASRDDLTAIGAFVNANYELYKMRPVRREELEPMMIVARWLKERAPDDGHLIHLADAHVPFEEIAAVAGLDRDQRSASSSGGEPSGDASAIGSGAGGGVGKKAVRGEPGPPLGSVKNSASA